MPDITHILTPEEVRNVLLYLDYRAHWRSVQRKSHKLNLTIFRLSCCCGLRRGEMIRLRCKDLILLGTRPCIRIRKQTTKGKREVRALDGTVIQKDQRRARVVPLWWDTETRWDLQKWLQYRMENLPDADGGSCRPESWFLCGVDARNSGQRINPVRISDRWRTAIRCLGPERQQQLSVHDGRHSFASLCLLAGRSLAEVKEALGHASIGSTSIYLHMVERKGVPDVFAF